MKKLLPNIMRNETGAVLPEHAVTYLLIIPILIAVGLIFYFNSGEPEGAVVNRGVEAIKPSRSMSPFDDPACGGTNPPDRCF